MNLLSRIFNIFIAIILLLISFPVLLLACLFILIFDGYPLFFTQKRVGKFNTDFKLYKLRTMKIDAPEVASHLLSSPKNHFTKTGKFLRKYSIDELPQLINIIRGEMNFIGPRPALYNQSDLIAIRKELGIDQLSPGVTGWAQINGRDNISIENKVELDRFYLINKSFLLNLKIIFLTIKQVIFPKDISH